ncbi:MAG: glycosyltransferase family 4 protein [Planctomycetes bacterium]|nr:glycosyltransferase family 4 protein [Planctomycetota bacterium]
MHILFFSHYFPPEVNAPAVRTWEHCRRWVASGHQVTVITCAPNCPTGKVFHGYRNRWKTHETIDGIRVIRVWTWLSANRGFLGRILNYVSYMFRAAMAGLWIRRVDVVVATSPQFFCGWAGVLAHWLKRRPLVLEIRDIWPESIVTVGAMRRSPATRLLEWLERRMYAAAERIVTVGEGYRRKLLQRGVPAAKIDVIPNGVDLATLPSARPRCEQTRNRPLLCGYVGTVGMAHGLEVVLAAAERLKERGRVDVEFEIVGEGAERAALEADAAQRGLLGLVRFRGMVSKEQAAELLCGYNAALVHLRGSELFETVLPSKIFEAMALGVPIVIGVRGPACGIVVSARAGLPMTPDDPESLIACLDAIAADPQAYANGRTTVARDFNRDALAARMLDVLVSLGDAPRPGAAASPQQRKAA